MLDFVLQEFFAEQFPEKEPSPRVWRRIQARIRAVPSKRRRGVLRVAAHALRRHLEEGVWRPFAQPPIFYSSGVYLLDTGIPGLAYTERQTLLALWCLSRAVPSHSF